MNNNFLPETEYKEFEDRLYINPQTGVDETDAFIENLRQSQQANNQQVATQARNLGTNVSSNLGGLIGGEGYWTSRYQTPQTNTAVSNLRATTQASALKEALANEQAIWKKRYQDAYRNYQQRAWNNSNATTDTTDPYANATGDEPEYESTSLTIEGVTPGIAGGSTVANIIPDWENPEDSTVSGYTYVPYGEDYKTNYTTKPTSYSNYIGTGASITRNYKDDSGHWRIEYRLPSGKTATTGWGETLKKGSDGGYYVHNKENNTYTYVGE